MAERFEKLKETIKDQKHGVISDQVLFDAFSVEALTQEFYGKLYNWYLWAVDDRSKITFPNRTDTDKDDRENIQTKMLRLITRLMFVWFIKQKHLVPDSLFDTKTLGGILRTFDPLSKTEGNYYNAILQNLFFATLNQEIADRQFISDKIFQGKSDSYTIKNLYRDNEGESWFTFPDDQKKQRVMQLFETVPYLNGGLFDCLDKFKYIPETQKWEADKFYDGFSSKGKRSPNGNYQYRAFVPNCFFFAPEHKEVVKEQIKGEYKDQVKDVCGLIELFGQYNFTVEENTPDDSEISLDPELLGKVFENLLAAYNPETQDSARKSTGSYYTPREIVDYMVNESLIAYLTGKCGHEEAAIRALFDDNQPTIPDNAQKVASDLRNIRILDPACGSGAFPMGILLRITTILERLQPSDFNKYQTKIELIKNCIFGIDIQPIAMLICKLRFFITLICDSEYNANDKQNNFGIIPLPSLETKFVAANSLLPAEVRKYDNDWTQDQQLLQLKQQLIALRKQALEIRSHRLKVKNQEADLDLCDQIEQYIISTATQPDQTKIEQWQREIEKAQAELPKYQHEQWVNETVAQQTLFEMSVPSMFRRDVNAPKRKELSDRIHNCENAIARERGKSAPSGFAEAIRKVARWNPYDQNTVSPFFDADWMFGVTEGFDIVISNPPYVQLQANKGLLASLYQNCKYESFFRTGDIYCLFFENGYNVLCDNGVLSFINPNTWLQSISFSPFRKYVTTKFNWISISITDKVFGAVVDTHCVVFQKSTKHSDCKIYKVYKNKGVCFLHTIEKNLISNTGNVINIEVNPTKRRIIDKIRMKSIFLSDQFNIYNGVKPFEKGKGKPVQTAEILKNKPYVKEGDKPSEKWTPLLRGSLMGRYVNRWNNNYWILYGEWLAAPRDKAIFDAPLKIIVRQTGDSIVATVIESGIICRNNLHICIPKQDANVYFTLGVLNSRLVNFYYEFLNPEKGEALAEVKREHIVQLPIPTATPEQQAKIIAKVDEILASKRNNPDADTSGLEGEIDKLVYKLYGLTYDEILIIDPETPITRAEYDA